MKDLRKEACEKFNKAALKFEKAKMISYAASCYYTACNYTKAATLYKEMKSWSQAGESLARCGKTKLHEAADLFEKGGLYLRAIECYE